MKICTKCGEEYPATSEYFGWSNKTKHIFQAQCKRCMDEYAKEYREKNKETIAERKKEYRLDNKEAIAESAKQYYKKNKEDLDEYAKRYYLVNKEDLAEHAKQRHLDNREARCEYAKQYYGKHKEAVAERMKQYQQDNKEIIAEYRKQYHLDNREVRAEYGKRYYLVNKEDLAEHAKQYRQEHVEEGRIRGHRHRARIRNLPRTLTALQWEETKEYFGSKCAYCGKEVPLTQDHFVPVTKGGWYAKNNIVPACGSCNSSKHNQEAIDWFRKQIFYSKSRQAKILKYLGFTKSVTQLSFV